ncbi:serine/arginine repetitive matrix protein 2 [Streptomyces sp. NPDC101733]|uniref:serine/arginine repetitive matrix protein 2 n=1 Tax=unclassified Streptomyces TaxID=2593676 RepID=UPI003830CA93
MADITPDFAIDYGLLHGVQSKLRDLATQAGAGAGEGAYKSLGDALPSERRRILGNGELSAEFNYFFTFSKGRQGKAKDGLNELADLFKSVSDVFFDADSQISGSAGVMGKSIGLGDWKNQKEAYDNWVQDKKEWDDFLTKIGATDYFKEHPDDSIRAVCGADDAPGWCQAWRDADDPPLKPGDAPPKPSDTPPTHYHSETSTGSVDVDLVLDKDNNVITEKSTVKTNGQTFTTSTTYEQGEPKMVTPPDGGKPYDTRDYTVTTTGGDGKTSVSTVVINDNGSGTMKVVQGDETTEYTRTGPAAKWEEVPKPEDDDSESTIAS